MGNNFLELVHQIEIKFVFPDPSHSSHYLTFYSVLGSSSSFSSPSGCLILKWRFKLTKVPYFLLHTSHYHKAKIYMIFFQDLFTCAPDSFLFLVFDFFFQHLNFSLKLWNSVNKKFYFLISWVLMRFWKIGEVSEFEESGLSKKIYALDIWVIHILNGWISTSTGEWSSSLGHGSLAEMFLFLFHS